AADTSLWGAAGGVQGGFNWQSGPFAAGVEGDFDWSNLKGSISAQCAFCGPATATLEHDVNWFGTARGRIGYAADGWLAYVTGGYRSAASSSKVRRPPAAQRRASRKTQPRAAGRSAPAPNLRSGRTGAQARISLCRSRYRNQYCRGCGHTDRDRPRAHSDERDARRRQL